MYHVNIWCCVAGVWCYLQQVFHQWWSTVDRCMCILVLYRVNMLGCSGLVSWYRWRVFQYWSTVDRYICTLALSHLNMWCCGAVAWCQYMRQVVH